MGFPFSSTAEPGYSYLIFHRFLSMKVEQYHSKQPSRKNLRTRRFGIPVFGIYDNARRGVTRVLVDVIIVAFLSVFFFQTRFTSENRQSY